MSANGKLTLAELATVAPGVQLAKPTAIAYKRLVAAAAGHGIRIAPAGGVGSGYRSLAVQKDFSAAFHGDAAAAKRVGLNPDSRIPVADPGLSSHGFGTRIDLLFNGSSWPTVAELALAREFGFTREFGANDANHFMHDGVTAITPEVQEDDVVSNAGSGTFTPSKPLALSTSEWRTWTVNAKGDYSFITAGGELLADVDVATRIENLPAGATIQARLAVCTMDGEKVKSVQYSDVVELQGSDGAAFPSFSDKVRLHPGQRVRLMFVSQHEGAAVVRVGLSVAQFKVA